MSHSNDFNPDWYSTPFETIRDILIDKNITLSAFQKSINMSDDELNALMVGKLNINIKWASLFAKELGASTNFWINRHQQYLDSYKEHPYSIKMKQYADEGKLFIWDTPTKVEYRNGYVSGFHKCEKIPIDAEFFEFHPVNDKIMPVRWYLDTPIPNFVLLRLNGDSYFKTTDSLETIFEILKTEIDKKNVYANIGKQSFPIKNVKYSIDMYDSERLTVMDYQNRELTIDSFEDEIKLLSDYLTFIKHLDESDL